MREPIMMDQLLDRILRESDYYARRSIRDRESSEFKSSAESASRLSSWLSFTGSGERILNSLRAWM